MGEIFKLCFDFAPFWIQIRNVSRSCMTEKVARIFGS